MSDQPENLMLVFLRRIDERLERVEREMSRRFTVIDARLSALEERQRSSEEWAAEVTLRLERIERRLDLVGTP